MSNIADNAVSMRNVLAGSQFEQATDRLLRELQKGLDSASKEADWLSETEVRKRLGLEK